MFDSLPTELAVAIIVEAAECFAATDRASAVSLALTARHVYHIIRPILLRRVFINNSNSKNIDSVFTSAGAGPLVRDLNITTTKWMPRPEVVSCLTNLYCIRGTPWDLNKVIPLLPQPAQESLSEVQSWSDNTVLSYVPPRVTRVCVYFDRLGSPPLGCLVNWLHAVPLITHIGAELIDIRDHAFVLPPEDLIRGLELVLEAGGSHLQRIAVRICGDPANDDPWEQLLDALKSWSLGSAMAAARANRRVALWRDQRRFDNLDEDMQATIDDSVAGVGVWSEARNLAEW